MDSNKRFLRYNSIAIVVWPIISVWTPLFLSIYKKDTPLFSYENFIPIIMNLTYGSIVVSLPFIIFAYWARLKIKIDNSEILLKSLAFTFYFILVMLVISKLVFWFDRFSRTEGGANIGLGMLLNILPLGLTVLLPFMHHIIHNYLNEEIE